MPTPCWLKHLCSIRALVPVSFFLSLSLSGWSPGAQRLSEFTFLPRLLRPSGEGTLHLHPIERVPEAFVNRASPMSGAWLAFCVNQGISASFSPLLSYHRLWTTRFRSIKGPQQKITAMDIFLTQQCHNKQLLWGSVNDKLGRAGKSPCLFPYPRFPLLCPYILRHPRYLLPSRSHYFILQDNTYFYSLRNKEVIN